jgi:hypothetical protein
MHSLENFICTKPLITLSGLQVHPSRNCWEPFLKEGIEWDSKNKDEKFASSVVLLLTE